ncbi:MAG: hypothetical protein E6590_17705 [Clostridiales bacterium]|uniref:hypothetical protein n=1 Tax=Zhenhengia sp. TaxID=2944208 RepID=UPI0029129E46|nr:hypothetical protein [Clostridiales bacterium]
MLTIEEYIARRKKEDRLNEFDVDKRTENMKFCVDYVFEYFNNYLNITKAEERTVLHNEKLEKFKKQFEAYDDEVQEWIVDIFNEHGKYIHKQVGNILRKDLFFFIYNKDAEFRKISYDCYSTLIKKMPFLQDKTEMLYLFIKEYHRVESGKLSINGALELDDNIREWLEETYKKHGVNLLVFVDEWVNYFYDHKEIWPSSHKKKSTSKGYTQYEYDYKQSSNLFNLDSLYRKLPKKAFIKGKKQELEMVMMYYWLYSIEGDEDYWEEYMNKINNAI